MPASSLRQLLKFVRVFGVAGGVRLWLSIRGQLGRRLEMLTLAVPGYRNPICLRPRDLPIFWQLMVMKEYAIDDLPQAAHINEIYKQALAEGHPPLIVDCGSHVGLSAIWFATCFPEALIYCIEPNSANLALLEKNTAPYSKVTVLNGGVWGKSCSLTIANPDAGSASFQLQEGSGKVGESSSLRSYTIDEVCSWKPGPLLAVKIDIEGAEAEVFAEPAPWMQQASIIAIELHDWLLPGKQTSRNLFRRLGENTFDVIIRGENLLLFQTTR
ncbi:MAG TPA: FkbM family methyltransferase [Acidobacteriaceae bacterium]|nr:FkbM family methyltransferase [Acidobacteriaceae bacterium]